MLFSCAGTGPASCAGAAAGAIPGAVTPDPGAGAAAEGVSSVAGAAAAAADASCHEAWRPARAVVPLREKSASAVRRSETSSPSPTRRALSTAATATDRGGAGGAPGVIASCAGADAATAGAGGVWPSAGTLPAPAEAAASCAACPEASTSVPDELPSSTAEPSHRPSSATSRTCREGSQPGREAVMSSALLRAVSTPASVSASGGEGSSGEGGSWGRRYKEGCSRRRSSEMPGGKTDRPTSTRARGTSSQRPPASRRRRAHSISSGRAPSRRISSRERPCSARGGASRASASCRSQSCPPGVRSHQTAPAPASKIRSTNSSRHGRTRRRKKLLRTGAAPSEGAGPDGPPSGTTGGVPDSLAIRSSVLC